MFWYLKWSHMWKHPPPSRALLCMKFLLCFVPQISEAVCNISVTQTWLYNVPGQVFVVLHTNLFIDFERLYSCHSVSCSEWLALRTFVTHDAVSHTHTHTHTHTHARTHTHTHTRKMPFWGRWNLFQLFGIALDWSKFAPWPGTICSDCFTWSSSHALGECWNYTLGSRPILSNLLWPLIKFRVMLICMMTQQFVI
jgi:hypothetical protein